MWMFLPIAVVLGLKPRNTEKLSFYIPFLFATQVANRATCGG